MIRDHKDIDKQLTVHTCSGIISIEELLGAVKTLYDTGPTPNHIWDMTDADLSHIKGKELQKIAQFARKYAPSGRDGKTAIVTSTDLSFAFGRMYETFADLSGQKVEVKIFRSIREAEDWIFATPVG